ncbi:Hint domain-containing protein [Octadecabacter ascidiaceicola]|uniref:Bifunctional hemolysin/adenylate cyclase n=1 Tax=Octadecabacter ascidiaceicola TaxID=1655543 RepID=A0A238K6G8_9RHOB|nr:Hint domain-containing protein [Octadecabacter ascidiaceicola]SMX38034.1 Bifunctional hemolysin/adenylate cyclase precursor [Octadecabacter ascidiaceicola]
MPQGYLVTLGDGSLDNGDAISGSQSTFTTSSTIGAGSWTWTGVWDGDGNAYNNVNDSGVYYVASDGNVYFVPDNWFTTSGTATAVSPPAYTAADGTVTGTAGNDVIDDAYSDTDGDSISSGNDTIDAAGGNDTVYGGGGDDSIDGGDGADYIVGDQTLANDGQDNISGGSGNDVIYGDTAAGTDNSPTLVSWANQGLADETSVAGGTTATSADGNINITVSVANEANFYGASVETGDPLYNYNSASDTSSLAIEGGDIATGGTLGNDQNAAVVTLDFSAAEAGYSDEVSNVTFGIFDIDELDGQFLDQIIVTAYDANGVAIPVSVTLGSTTTLTSTTNANGSQTVTAIVNSGGAGNTDSQTGYAHFTVAGPVSYIEIDYNNVDTAYGGHAIRIGDVELTPIPEEPEDGANDTIDGGIGDDVIYGQGGDDSINGGTGIDTIYGGIGADVIDAGADNDSVTGGEGNDTVTLGAGNDTFGDWSTDDGNDTVFGGAGNDTINGGNDDDELHGGADDDTLIGASGDDTLYGGTGDDAFWITDDHNSDIIVGGEDVGDGDVDTVSFYNYSSTDGVTVTATGDEAGTYDFDGTVGTGTFTEIEAIETTDYDDTVDLTADNNGVDVSTFDGNDDIITGGGDDVVDGGQGSDTFNTGAGDDQINLGDDGAGSPDGDADVIVLEDGFGEDVVTNFDAPTPDGDGTFTGIDTLDVSGLYDLPLGDPNRTPVLTNDVTVTDDGSGNALLTFPNGETITLVGISPTDADNPFYLNAIGIPMPDGTVEGTIGADNIGAGYTGDPDGDMVDAGDAILPGDTNNDDLIYGYGGNDTIYSGTGADEVYGGDGDDTLGTNGDPTVGNTLSGDAGNDTILGGSGDDTILGGTGDDTVFTTGGSTDTIEGGEDAGNGDVDTLNFVTQTFFNAGVDVTMSGNEAGTYTYVTDGGTGSGTFSEIEQFNLTDENDSFDGVAATGGSTVDGRAGDDTLVGSSGDDSFIGGTGNDTLNANAGSDSLDGGEGNDTVFGDEGDDVIDGGDGSDELHGGDDNDIVDGGADDDTIYGGSGDDTLTGGDGADTIIGGADQDVIYGGAGDVIDGSETGTDNDTLIVSGVDYIDYDTNPENGTVYFEGGGSLTFTNIENVVVSDRDGTVSGTAGNDTINSGYVGDPDGDQVDDTDAILEGHEPNDDLIEAGAGDDTVMAGLGDDTVYGEAGNDLIIGQDGTDTIYGGSGDDIINGGVDADTIFGGDGDDRFVQEANFGNDVIEGGEGGTDNDEIWSTQNVDITVTTSGDEAGTISDGTSTATFTEIEAIQTEGGNDTINLSGGSAGMTVDSGAGDDTITGGVGNDVIDTGTGDDLVHTNNGDNTITLGTGDDEIILGNGDETAYGGTGQDIFHVDDTSGTNTVVGGEGNDGFGDILNSNDPTPVNVTTSGDEAGTMTTGTTTVTFSEIEVIQTDSGNDTVDISNDSFGMTVFAYDGDDTITGGSGDDLILAGDGDDELTGGEGDDTFYAGAGDDDITFSEGDTADGGSGDDLFVLEDLGETSNGTITIDGGAGDETGGDTLQLGNLGVLTQAVRDTFVDDGTGSYSGSITLDDGSILNFSEIENIICFTPNTRIATPTGLVAIEDLEVGDLVVTRDHGLQPIRWIEGRTVPAIDRFAPIKIRKNVLSGQDRDLIVSPQHRVLFQGYRAELLFGESEVLVAATHLVDGMDVTQDEAEMVTYVHILFDQHEIIYAEGAATESFHPGDIGFSAVGDAAREELFAIFPELRVDPRQYGSTARRCLKSHEAKLIRT